MRVPFWEMMEERTSLKRGKGRSQGTYQLLDICFAQRTGIQRITSKERFRALKSTIGVLEDDNKKEKEEEYVVVAMS